MGQQWDVSNIKDMSYMFYMNGCWVSNGWGFEDTWGGYSEDISNWKVSLDTNIEKMFSNSYECTDIAKILKAWGLDKLWALSMVSFCD